MDGDDALELPFLMDTGARFSSVTSALLRVMKEHGAVLFRITLNEKGRRSDIVLLHLEVPSMGEMILRAVINNEVKPAIGRVDVDAYDFRFDPATRTVSSDYFEEEFVATVEEPRLTSEPDFRGGRPQTASS